ncbi:MAG: hypothetical protein HYZ65_01700 [Burkholderiales bacterium]|nr:hypothetical protein [Burkholderiales bacterium]
MPNYFSLNALLLAIPELRKVAPEHYASLIAAAEKTAFTTHLSHWRAVLAGLAMCWLYFGPTSFKTGQFWADMLAGFGLFCLVCFAADCWYLRILRKSVLTLLRERSSLPISSI